MAEWSIAAVLKTVDRVSGPGVRIPLSPPDPCKSVTPIGWQFLSYGEVAERSNAAVSKTVVRRKVDRGFESPPLRSYKLIYLDTTFTIGDSYG